MLYTNRNLKIVEKEMKFGKLKCVVLGEEGRGRCCEILPVPQYFKVGEWIDIGIHEDLTIGTTKSGRYRINKAKDNDNMYLILSTKDGYTRRGNGSISLMEYDNTEEIVEAWGADGDAGRIGQYPVSVIRVPMDGKTRVIKTTPSGKDYRKDDLQHIYYICKNQEVEAVYNGYLKKHMDEYDCDMTHVVDDLLFRIGTRVQDVNRGVELLDILNNLKRLSADDIKNMYADKIQQKYGRAIFITNDFIQTGRSIRDNEIYTIIDQDTIEKINNIVKYDFLDRFVDTEDIYIIKEYLTRPGKLFITELISILEWNINAGYLK